MGVYPEWMPRAFEGLRSGGHKVVDNGDGTYAHIFYPASEEGLANMAKTDTVDAPEIGAEIPGVDDPAQNTNIQVEADGSLKLNWKAIDAEAGSAFEPFPNGNYRARVTGSKNKVARTSGAPMVEIKFTISEEGPALNRNVWRNFTLTPKAMYYFKKFLAATGQYTEEELAAEDFTYDGAHVQGAEVVLEMVQEPYTDNDGKPRIRMSVKEVIEDDGSSSWGS
jgi:hypothetical protein